MQKIFSALLVAAAIHTPGYAGDIVRAEFNSMSACLAAIKNSSGKQLEILRDKPDLVSGYLAGTRRDFVCEKMVTGSKGTYYKGWYEKT